MKRAVAYLLPFMEKEKQLKQQNSKEISSYAGSDVHDIGKNIVGVVLGCNNYKIHVLMVSCETILSEAKRLNVDIIGLSGLITPSLDEMCHVAKEMKRAGLDIPLLIGGATTSRMHTAVKIAPHYCTVDHPVLHVLDASKSVVVVSSLLNPNKDVRTDFVEDQMELYEDMREDYYQGLSDRSLMSFTKACKHRLNINWKTCTTPPLNSGQVHTEIGKVELESLLPFIDWHPFFQTWELRGRYPNRGFPQIFNDKIVGEEAKKLFNDVQMIKEIIKGKLLELRAVHAVYPANAAGNVTNDIDVYANENERENGKVAAKFCMLRQQLDTETDSPMLDHLGMFVVSVFGCEKLVARYEEELDDYKKIMVQAISDRFAEAYAEELHRRIRQKTWGYAKEEQLNHSELLKLKYQGIRPAPGYPSQPDHTEKKTMWKLMDVEAKSGIILTDSLAMKPASSVSALVFGNAVSEYFAVGHINKDQVESYSIRKSMTVSECEKWLAPILNYDP
eukprot:GSMAST32.ASY1.ANO1.1966.1 assembled CDS